MPGPSSAERIDELMEEASRALAQTNYFTAEALARKALLAARKADDFERLARICMPLQEARRQRVMQAMDACDEVRIIDEPFDESIKLKPGCVLVQPPLVAADARRLRELALEREIPIVALCREPLTQLKLQPIVALGPVVLRTKVRPPRPINRPDKAWLIDAIDALGDVTIDEIDPGIDPVKRVDALIDRMETLPEHDRVHQVLADAAHTASRAMAA